MDWIQIVQDLGIPVTLAGAMFWGCVYLIKYITKTHSETFITRIDELRGILIKLIDQQKLMQMNLVSLESNIKTLVEFLIEERDKEKERLINKLKEKNGRV